MVPASTSAGASQGKNTEVSFKQGPVLGAFQCAYNRQPGSDCLQQSQLGEETCWPELKSLPKTLTSGSV